jgi:hypothetical protein
VDIPAARVARAGAAAAPSALARVAARLAGTGRIYGAQRNVRQAHAVELGVRLADGWNPLLLASYVAFMARAGDYAAYGYQLTIPPTGSPARPDAALLGLMDVRVVLSRTPLTDPRLVPAGAVDGTLIYRNTADAGPGYLVRPGPSGGPPALDHVQLLGAPTAAARATQLTSEAETFSFTTSAPAYFVVATPDYPGWTARLDGRPVAITDIAGVLPAVRVAPGRHVLSYTYAPRSVVLGAALSALGLFALLAWLMLAVPFAGIFRSPLTPRRGCAR